MKNPLLRRFFNSPHEQLGETSKNKHRSNILPMSHKKTLWQRFKTALLPYLLKSKRFAEVYSEAITEKERSEARKVAEQAYEIAARKDLIKQNETIVFSNIVNDIFADDGLPPAGKVLKLAKLMQNNPGIQAWLEEANKIFQKSCLVKHSGEFEYIKTERKEKLSS